MTPSPLELPFDLDLVLPGSKSHANRALIAACLAGGHSELHNATACDDVVVMVEGLQRLGFRIEWRDQPAGHLVIDGGIPSRGAASETIDCGHAGTALRFLTALACVVPGEWKITGSARMQQRPIGPLVAALRQLGAGIEDCDGFPPIRVTGGTLRGGVAKLDASVSSQYVTALDLVSPVVDDPIELELAGPAASPEYIELTEKVKSDFGVESPGDRYVPIGKYEIEGDWSAVGSFLVLAEISGSRVRGSNLSVYSRQADRSLPRLVEQMRAVGDLEIDVFSMPDQLMNLAVLAAHRVGQTRFTGAANLRHKECDRLAVITRELRKAGVDIEEEEDGVVVRGPTELRPARLDPHDDHRMVMAFAILAMTHEGIEIMDAECVQKSYPGFFGDIEGVRAKPRGLALIGMRGAGKTTLGRALATRLGWEFVDTDSVIEGRVGPIAAYVEQHGWERFRALEREVVAACLSADRSTADRSKARVVALGGGAVEVAETRQLLAASSTVVLVEADLETLRARVAASDRPSLSGGDSTAELEAILESRRIYYKALADLTVSGVTVTDDEVDRILGGLKDLCSW